MTNLIAIAVGGALGAVSRYGIMVLLSGLIAFPMGTLAVNILGSFTFGALLELNALKLNLAEPIRLALFVGFLGAFTTFSTFSMDVMHLLQKDELAKASLYILTSVTGSIIAFYAGMKLVKTFTL